MSEKRSILPRPASRLRVRIDSPDPLVEASLRAALDQDATIELADTLEHGTLLLWDAGATRAATRERMAALPVDRTAFLVLIVDAADVQLALAVGAQGIMLRELDPEKLRCALKAVQHGLTVIDGVLFERIKRLPAPETASGVAPDTLTARELEVLQLVSDGLSNRRIAARLGISDHTVKFHVNAILEKLEADSRTEAVVTAVRRGILWL